MLRVFLQLLTKWNCILRCSSQTYMLSVNPKECIYLWVCKSSSENSSSNSQYESRFDNWLLIPINVLIQGYSPLGKGVESNILKNPVLHTTAEKLGKTPAQIALRWGLQVGHSIVPKSTNSARIKENFDLFDWSIPEDLLVNFNKFEQVSHAILRSCTLYCWIPKSF